MNTKQRIIITAKGTEVQNLLRDSINQQTINIKTSQQEQKERLAKEIRQSLNISSAPEALQSYAIMVQNRLKTPDQIQQYLETKVLSCKQKKIKFIERQVEKASMIVFKNSQKDDSVKKLMPSLDFRQTQVLKQKYNNSLSLFKVKSYHQDYQNQQSDQSNLNLPEVGNKRVSQLLFQESKLERMVDKFENFQKKTSNQPRFDQVYRRDVLQSPKFFKNLGKDKTETRVESLQELNAKLMDKLTLLDYATDIKERQKQVLEDLHTTKYGKFWKQMHIPGNKSPIESRENIIRSNNLEN